MESIHIHGGVELQGKVKIQGSKNAVLPILAATILTKESNVIHNCPKIADVEQMLNLLRSIGCTVSWKGQGVRIDTENINFTTMPEDSITGMRSSLCLMGVLLGRTGRITMEYPGGCSIGARPIDYHLDALGCMGVIFCEKDNCIEGYANDGLEGTCITLPKPSVGATENIIMAAVLAKGTTTIKNAAREPEILILCDYLTQCGAQITGVGTDEIEIKGGMPLHGIEFRVPADRIVAGTYLFACLGAGGSVLLEEAPVQHMKAVIQLARHMGAECQEMEDGLYVQAPEHIRHPAYVETESYPGFPTDLQSMLLVVLATASGQCLIRESIFENRYRIVKPLKEMGANVWLLDDKHVLIRGTQKLLGRKVRAEELRGGAALVIAGLMAEGVTSIEGCQYIVRGYENICKDLRELGARIHSL
jgi:UDP-N-acetylglucosamine 1-carboxyvinyltransferase